MPGLEREVVVVGLDAAADAVHDRFEIAELPDARARPAQRDRPRPSRRAAAARSTASPTTYVRASDASQPSRSAPARSATLSPSPSSRSGGSQRGRAAVDRRGDGFERGSRDAERREPLGAHAAQHAGAHAVAEERGHRREPVARDAAPLRARRRSSPATASRHSSAKIGPASTNSRVGEQLARSSACIAGRHAVDADARARRRGRGSRGARRAASRVPRDRVEVLAREAFEAVVAVGEQVHRAGAAHDDATRRERARAREPEPVRAGDRARVGLAAEHQHVDLVALHLGRGTGRARRRAHDADSVELGPAREPQVAVVGDRDDLLAAVAGSGRRPRRPARTRAPCPAAARSTRRTRRRGRCR